MTKEVRAKTFKSGNSVALRLPKTLGIKEGVEMTVREEHGRYLVEPVETPQKKIDLSFLDGRRAGLKLLRPEDREIEPSVRNWPRTHSKIA
jgi:antitoxin VapB